MQAGSSVLPLDRITIDDALWPRLQLVRERVELFARIYEEHGPSALPPVEVVPLPPDYLLSEGRTRYEAARQLGWDSLPATVVPVPPGEEARTFAFVHALESCTRTSAPLTAAERKHAAYRLLALHPDYRDADVAKALGVARTTVLRWRHEVEGRGGANAQSGEEDSATIEGSYQVARRLFRGIEAIHGLGLANAAFKGYTGKRLADLFRETYGERALKHAQQFRGFLDVAVSKLQEAD